jgi:hypothetical protein
MLFPPGVDGVVVASGIIAVRCCQRRTMRACVIIPVSVRNSVKDTSDPCTRVCVCVGARRCSGAVVTRTVPLECALYTRPSTAPCGNAAPGPRYLCYTHTTPHCLSLSLSFSLSLSPSLPLSTPTRLPALGSRLPLARHCYYLYLLLCVRISIFYNGVEI